MPLRAPRCQTQRQPFDRWHGNGLRRRVTVIPSVNCDGRLWLSHGPEHRTESVVKLGLVRRKRQRVAVVVDGIVKLAERLQHQSEVGVRIGGAGPQHRSASDESRAAAFGRSGADHAEHVQRIGMLRICRENLAVKLFRLVKTAGAVVRESGISLESEFTLGFRCVFAIAGRRPQGADLPAVSRHQSLRGRDASFLRGRSRFQPAQKWGMAAPIATSSRISLGRPRLLSGRESPGETIKEHSGKTLWRSAKVRGEAVGADRSRGTIAMTSLFSTG